MKVNKNLLYTLWSAAIIFCVFISLFSLCFAAFSGGREKVKDPDFTVETEPPLPDPPPEETAEPTPPPAVARLGETADAGREYLDKIIFLGDSTTYGIGVYYGLGYTELCPPSQVWTPASGTLTLSYYNIATVVYPETGEEISITEAVERAKPEYLMLTLGVNGISFMDEEWFIRDYTALIELIRDASPDTKIILNSIYPVAASYPNQDDINNDKINAANRWIERIAEDTGCRYLYSFESLVGSDGNLPEESQNGDGLHLTGEAFTTVMQYIRTHAYE
ncbi:MAG: SGNH/GDSL hydrolase family protein [Kiritimatiellae bacterium]|nr:SGNH/GDSL hydrolase family protein [Kiritimatiellia bacterium]